MPVICRTRKEVAPGKNNKICFGSDGGVLNGQKNNKSNDIAMYKDNPNNRRLNRVGKPLGSVKDPAKKTLSGKTAKGKTIKYKLPKDEEKLKKLQEETKKLKSMTVAKPGKLKKLQEETKKLKSMVEKQKPKGKYTDGEAGYNREIEDRMKFSNKYIDKDEETRRFYYTMDIEYERANRNYKRQIPEKDINSIGGQIYFDRYTDMGWRQEVPLNERIQGEYEWVPRSKYS
tara:strand:+ start:102 stop:791 length:690 start_codon:yes stop_codon:yes gene_type:complete